MTDALLDMLPSAIGVAVSPIPIVAVILMLMSKRAKTNSLAFVAGWVIALTVVSGIILWLASVGELSPSSEPSRAVKIISLLLGFGLLYLAEKNWLKRPKKGAPTKTPVWMTTIDEFSTVKSFGFGFVLAGINPKNLLLTAAGTMTIVSANLSGSNQLVLIFTFVIIGSLTVLAPVVYYLLSPKTATDLLLTAKSWLVQNNAVIMSVLLLIIGIKILIGTLT